MQSARILALEPYYGGSHRAFLDVWMRHSRHVWTLETMPARHWKWRMRGSAMWFAERLQDAAVGQFDCIFTCDMTSVADLRALLPKHLRPLPIVCYFHENQLTYPLSPTDWRDYQYGFTNITSALAADTVWFNSHAHCDAFLEAAEALLRRMSDCLPREAVAAIQNKAKIVYPAVESVGRLKEGANRPAGPLRILWSHRWEYDKNPEAFFKTMFRLHDAGAAFELVMVGEQFRKIPDAFVDGFERLKPHIAHTGYVESKEAYLDKLRSCDVVVSTAIQENFGIAVVEAMLAGCHPLLPDRLSYPELLPKSLASRCLYDDEDQLFACLRDLCAAPDRSDGSNRQALVDSLLNRFAAPNQTERLDNALAAV